MDLDLIALKSILEKSELEISEKRELLDLLGRAHNEELSDVVAFLEENPGWIRKIYDNYLEKKKALNTNNPASWQIILEKEINDLKQLE